ncbi:MAG: hypothetical protein HY258_03010 [Chloroflexi bacterium]|nr:hypothetical protein [Chloroflexota bacterium]
MKNDDKIDKWYTNDILLNTTDFCLSVTSVKEGGCMNMYSPAKLVLTKSALIKGLANLIDLYMVFPKGGNSHGDWSRDYWALYSDWRAISHDYLAAIELLKLDPAIIELLKEDWQERLNELEKENQKQRAK